jgi:hypothetical protein
MSTQPEALRLADALETAEISYTSMVRAAAELRRLHAENERFAALVCDYAAEEAPDAIRKIAVDRDRWHTKAQQAEAQRDALLEALKDVMDRLVDRHETDEAAVAARAAINAVEGESHAKSL